MWALRIRLNIFHINISRIYTMLLVRDKLIHGQYNANFLEQNKLVAKHALSSTVLKFCVYMDFVQSPQLF